ncbi:MAG: DMT family transporter [Chloroflexota bacterium]|nr:MAG: hypothetical protein DLM70_06230 [Chloroflexota bacterium]
MGIVLGLLTAVCWGTADFLARYATRLVGTYRTLLFMQLPGLVALSAYMLASGELARLGDSGYRSAWAWAVVTALTGTACSLSLYRSFEVGVLSLVSPIAASYAAVTVILAVLSGEHIGLLHTIGIVTTIGGVVLAAAHLTAHGVDIPPHSGRFPPGVMWAIGAALGYGFTFWIFGSRVAPVLGGVAPVWVTRLVTPLTLVLLALPARQNLRASLWPAWKLLLGIGIIDTLAFVSVAFGFTTGQIAIVSVLASLFSTVTVILAWIFLREQLYRSQWTGIACIFVGIALVSVRV